MHSLDILPDITDKDINLAVGYSIQLGLPMPRKIRELPRPMLEHAFLAKLIELHNLKKEQHGYQQASATV